MGLLTQAEAAGALGVTEDDDGVLWCISTLLKTCKLCFTFCFFFFFGGVYMHYSFCTLLSSSAHWSVHKPRADSQGRVGSPSAFQEEQDEGTPRQVQGRHAAA